MMGGKPRNYSGGLTAHRMVSTCDPSPMLPTGRGMNGTEQKNKIVLFILYFENTFWSILLFVKYFLKLLFENTLRNDEG